MAKKQPCYLRKINNSGNSSPNTYFTQDANKKIINKKYAEWVRRVTLLKGGIINNIADYAPILWCLMYLPCISGYFRR